MGDGEPPVSLYAGMTLTGLLGFAEVPTHPPLVVNSEVITPVG